MEDNPRTEKQKAMEYAITLAELCGVSAAEIIIKDVEVPRKLYLGVLKMMEPEALTSHLKGCIEEERYEQAQLVNQEIKNR